MKNPDYGKNGNFFVNQYTFNPEEIQILKDAGAKEYSIGKTYFIKNRNGKEIYFSKLFLHNDDTIMLDSPPYYAGAWKIRVIIQSVEQIKILVDSVV